MSDMVRRGFVEKCAACRVNPRAMLAYADALQKQAGGFGMPEVPLIGWNGPYMDAVSGSLPASVLKALNTVKGPAIQLGWRGEGMASRAGRAAMGFLKGMRMPSMSTLGVGAIAGGTGAGAVGEGQLAGWLAGHKAPPALGPGMVNPKLGPPPPPPPPPVTAHGAGLAASTAGGPHIPGLNPLQDAIGEAGRKPGMAEKAVGFLKSHKGAVGAGAGAAGAAAAGAGYLKSKAKKKDKADKKEE